jgi:MFS family permease
MLTVLKNWDFFCFQSSAFITTLAAEILTVSMSWMIYAISHDAFDLALVGLVQFIPTLLLVMFTGSFADRFSRRRIILICMAVEFLSMLGIYLTDMEADTQLWQVLSLLALLGAGRAFMTPAASAIAPNLVKREEIGAAIACSTASWQLAAIAGPALGGLLYGVSPTFAYGTALTMVALGILMAFGIRHKEQPRKHEQNLMDSMLGGFHYMLKEKVVLGATTLDLFAVLLGSTVMLLPIYASDILVGEPWELGVLRASIGVGALCMALYLGLYPIRRRAGHVMFATVAVFGIGTIVFGLSKSLILSVVALAVMGASDMISVYIREVLIMLWTPDHLRGRVSAVNGVLINASNDLGSFRAGSSAKLFGPVAATVLGGICTLTVALLWLYFFPKLRQADDLSAVEEATESA